jgi:hypothetical protein
MLLSEASLFSRDDNPLFETAHFFADVMIVDIINIIDRLKL